MELKFDELQELKADVERFNRTFMELKYLYLAFFDHWVKF